MQELCINSENGRAKVRYKTRTAAAKAARRSEAGLHLRIYQCPYGQHFHLTSRAPREHGAMPPSAAKLKRRLENAGREIAACQRRMDAAHAILAKQLEKAARMKAEAEEDHRTTVAAIEAMTNNIVAGRAPAGA